MLEGVTFTKAAVYSPEFPRYNVFLDGIRVGWVDRIMGTWSMAARVDSGRGKLLADGEKTRTAAAREGLSDLRIFHLGRIVQLNPETMDDEVVFLDVERLKQVTAWDDV